MSKYRKTDEYTDIKPDAGRVEETSAAARYADRTGPVPRSMRPDEETGAGHPGHEGRDYRIPSGGGHTEEEYLTLPDDIRVELIEGEFFEMTAPSRLHQSVLQSIFIQLDHCMDAHRDCCFLYIAPCDIALGEDRMTVVQPDLYIHCDRDKDVAEGPYRGAPDFALEVLSPSNQGNDLWRKRELYRKCGVREYWIVNPEEKEVLVFCFEKEKEDKGPQRYSFDDKVPVGISGGECEVDFRDVYRRVKHFYE